MATDYDAPRGVEDDEGDGLKSLRTNERSGRDDAIDVDDSDLSDVELPGADLSDESLDIRVVPEQADEFTCSRCLLVRHRAQYHHKDERGEICNDCALETRRHGIRGR